MMSDFGRGTSGDGKFWVKKSLESGQENHLKEVGVYFVVETGAQLAAWLQD